MGALELGLATVHHQLGVLASKDDNTVAPLSISQHAASQQNLFIVQWVRLTFPLHLAIELGQPIVGRLTDDLRCQTQEGWVNPQMDGSSHLPIMKDHACSRTLIVEQFFFLINIYMHFYMQQTPYMWLTRKHGQQYCKGHFLKCTTETITNTYHSVRISISKLPTSQEINKITHRQKSQRNRGRETDKLMNTQTELKNWQTDRDRLANTD